MTDINTILDILYDGEDIQDIAEKLKNKTIAIPETSFFESEIAGYNLAENELIIGIHEHVFGGYQLSELVLNKNCVIFDTSHYNYIKMDYNEFLSSMEDIKSNYDGDNLNDFLQGCYYGYNMA